MTNKQLETRLKVFAYVLVGIFFIILARLWYMQIIRGEHYSTLAEGNRIRRIPDGPKRHFLRQERRAVGFQQAFLYSFHSAASPD